ncbi:HNH endonuclease signature motif containing protein [Pseudonocardia spinosispora]|uniref:HNH endonuclease signature motif containing protein n=1 Tax=Pseudonocardia spinosispora TaxID=103441 RepID=UPI0012EC4FD1|nr:HNH endonuclease signature motif containing protein [Pseudonocardia spinosispora]
MAAAGVVPEGLASMAPGPELAAALARIDRSSVSNGDLVEVLKARYRLQAHVAAQLAADIAALGGRDPEADPREIALVAEPGRYMADELRVALSWTRRKSDAELDFSWLLLSRLPLVFDALDSGLIDLPKARIFATYLADLPDAQRTEICQAVLPKTPPWTTGKLAAYLRKLVIGSDPDRAQDLYEKAFERRSVVGYLNEDSTATLSASGIAPEDMAAACTRVNALARAIKQAGYPARVDQIRADVFCGLLDGTLHGLDRAGIVAYFLGQSPAGKPQGIEIRAELATLLDLSDRPGELPGWGPILAANTRRTVLQQRGGSWTFAVCDDHGYLLVPGVLRSRPTHATHERAGGAVELQLTATLLAQLAQNPPPGWERVIADIATQCAAWPQARTMINSRPGHRFPAAALRLYSQIRDRNCLGPGCRRPARESEFDHTIDFHHGGPTTDTNGGQLCAHDHDLKTRGRWRLQQPTPGQFRWTSPFGQTHRTRGDPIITPPPSTPSDDPPPF